MANLSNDSWEAVSSKNPCPVCAKTSWCRRNKHNKIIVCRRNFDDNAHSVKEDDNGVPYAVYLPKDFNSNQVPQALKKSYKKVVKFEKASDFTLNEVYSAFLASLTLTELHKENLQRRGLTDDEIELLGYKSVTGKDNHLADKLLAKFGKDTLQSVPGFHYEKVKGWQIRVSSSALLIPCRNDRGQIIALRLRLDKPLDDGGKYLYFSSPMCSSGVAPHIPLNLSKLVQRRIEISPKAKRDEELKSELGKINDSLDCIRVTEGEIKADIATLRSSIPTISIPGISCYKKADPILEMIKPENVVICFDADVMTNKFVAQAQANFHKHIEKDYEVCLEIWDEGLGKGIDDVFTAGHKPKLIEDEDDVEDVIESCLLSTGCLDNDPYYAAYKAIEELLPTLEGRGVSRILKDKYLEKLLIIEKRRPDKYEVIKEYLVGLGLKVNDLKRYIKNYQKKKEEEEKRELQERYSLEKQSSFFRPLGKFNLQHYFYNVQTREVQPMGKFDTNLIVEIAPKPFWDANFAPYGRDNADWHECRSFLIQSNNKKRFNPNSIRGAGVWHDRGRTIVNTGRDIFVDGKKYSDFTDSEYIYIASSNEFSIPENKLSVGECRQLIDTIEAFEWKNGITDAIFLAGWIVTSRIAAALPHRPHLWISGTAGTGKSTLMQRVVLPALGGAKRALALQGGSTEAGIRQTIGCDSVPVVFDEFETTETNKNSSQIKSVIDLLRQTWSQTCGRVAKGGSDGLSNLYQLNFAGLVSSIRVDLSEGADRSRFAVCELKKHGSTKNKRKEIEEKYKRLDSEYGDRLFARSLSMIDVILESYEVFREVLSDIGTSRFADQFGMLLAGYSSLISDDVISEEDARSFISTFMNFKDELEETIPDEDECLSHLLESKLKYRNPETEEFEEEVIGEIVQRGTSKNCEPFSSILARHGMKVENGRLLVSNTHLQMKSIYADTKWKQWGRSLRRLPGAETTGTKYIGGSKTRCVAIPLECILQESA